MSESKKAVVTVLGYDRKGIIAKVSAVLYECDANIVDISQTVLVRAVQHGAGGGHFLAGLRL